MFVYCSKWQKYAWKPAEEILSGKIQDGMYFRKLSIWEFPNFQDFWNQFTWEKRDFEMSPYYRATHKLGRFEAHKIIGIELFGKKVVYPLCIDHDNSDIYNNHPSNLQVIFSFENQEKGKNFKGGVYETPGGRFKSYFRGKYLGTRDTWMQAKNLREDAIQKYLRQNSRECNRKDEYNKIIEMYLKKEKLYKSKHGDKLMHELTEEELWEK